MYMEDSALDDKAARSVLVGNIPDNVTEQRLRKIFKEVGYVVSFTLVHDRESGKRKGYGFCEYKNPESVISAIRGLNNYEIHGHELTVENIRTEDARLDLRLALTQSNVQSRFSDPTSFNKTSEVDKKHNAALPPDKMFELMKQVKHYLDNTPNDSKEMLIQHPQLSYAILRGMILMDMIDAKSVEVLQLEDSSALMQSTQDTDLRNSKILGDQSMRLPPTHIIASSFTDQKNTIASRDPHLHDSSNSLSAVRAHGKNAERTGLSTTNIPSINSTKHTGIASTTTGSTTKSNISKLILPPDSDNEKAALIMQVLALTDEQVANFPPEQRLSIQALRETLANGAKTTR